MYVYVVRNDVAVKRVFWESSRSHGECVYVYVVRNDVAVKRVFWESSRSRGECVYVYVVRSDVAVKRVFYGDNNSDINVYIRELILSNKDRNLQILLTG